MKLIPPLPDDLREITLDHLLPTGEELMVAAYDSMAGDAATSPEGRHGGRAPDKLDMNGISKRMMYQRAGGHDLAWFDAVAAAISVNPFTWAPSLRTEVPKGKGRGTRPIDDPPTDKRLVALSIRSKLKSRLIARFTDGQVGSRPGTFCTRVGSTAQDHVAVAVWNAIKARYTWCVLIDLKDAFPRVPKRLALREFGRVGLDPEAAKFLWNVVRINAVTHRNQASVERRDHMGIEQGNPLSAYIMDLVLAPVMRRTEARHDVRAYSYLDDIYIMARTEREAHDAYNGFRSIAEGLGIDNVRGLWVPGGREPKGKNSLIVDSAVTPIRVLKSTDVDILGISPAPQKEMQYRLDIKKDGKKLRRMTLNEARNALACQALTAKATRARNHLLFRHPPALGAGRCRQSPSDSRRPSSPSGSCTGMTGTRGVDNRPKEKVTDEVQQPFSPEEKDVAARENPVEEPISLKRTGPFNGVSYQSRRIQGDHEGVHLSVLPEDADNLFIPTVDVQEVGVLSPHVDEAEAACPSGRVSRGHHHVPDVVLPLGVGDLGLGHVHHHGDVGFAGSSQRNQAGSVHLFREGDSSRSEGSSAYWRSRGPDRADDGDRPVPHVRLLSDPAVQGALAAGHGFKFGDRCKGAVLDLTGLEDLGLDDKWLIEVVNGLIKAVRTKGVATVIIDPAEPWTATSATIGRMGDATYKRVATTNVSDGRVMLTLRHRVTREKPVRRGPGTPPAGADAVLSVKCMNRASGTYELRSVEDGAHVLHKVVVNVASPVSGAVAAVAVWAASRTGKDIAVPVHANLDAASKLLLKGECKIPSIDFGDAVRALLAGRVWTPAGRWALGRSVHASPAGYSPAGTPIRFIANAK